MTVKFSIENYPGARVDLREKPCPTCGRSLLVHCIAVAVDAASPWGSSRHSFEALPDNVTCRETMITARRALTPEAWARIGFTIAEAEEGRCDREDLVSVIFEDFEIPED